MNLEVDNSEWDVHLKRTLEKWMAPGLAVTVLKDKELVYSRGLDTGILTTSLR